MTYLIGVVVAFVASTIVATIYFINYAKESDISDWVPVGALVLLISCFSWALIVGALVSWLTAKVINKISSTSH